VSQENAEVVRAGYERAARGDFGSFEEFAENFEFATSPEMPDAGTYRGEAARAWIASWVGSFEGLSMEATEIIDAGDKVLVGIFQRGRPRGSDAMVEGRWWQVMTFRDGLIARSELFPERVQALKAVGLAE
jgi:ketosteroid isomerase-like protein